MNAPFRPVTVSPAPQEPFGSSASGAAPGPTAGLSVEATSFTIYSLGRSSMISASCEVAPSSLNLRADTSTRDSKDAIASL